jgi:DNA modification methylase
MVGSCLDRMRELPDASVDAVVTDPPYELGFMGKSWDSSGIAFNADVWAECLRVLKPGGHLLAFGGSRTWHRIAVAVEDAGFQIRDSVAWLYGSGFPKSLDVSKAIDKAAGVEREVMTETVADIFGEREEQQETTDRREDGTTYGLGHSGKVLSGEAITDDAVKWQGWGTALKPAFEPVIVARKPLVGTVAANVLEFGTGALNIDGTRIGTSDNLNGGAYAEKGNRAVSQSLTTGSGMNMPGATVATPFEQPAGRWPSNVVLDEFTAGLVDEQSGALHGRGNVKITKRAKAFFGSAGQTQTDTQYINDAGGASRFFYVAKASKRDRNEGLDDLQEVETGAMAGNLTDGQRLSGNGQPIATPKRQNFHPTVKPTDLMRQLVRLVTPPGGVVLDPFTGSGSTGKAAILEGFEFIGCELTEEYLPIIEGRLNHAVATVKAEQDREEEKLF